MVKLVNFVMFFYHHYHIHTHTDTHTHIHNSKGEKNLLGPHHDLGLEQDVEMEVTAV